MACCSAQEIDNFLAEYETPTGSQLSPAQRKAVKQMLTAPVSVICSGDSVRIADVLIESEARALFIQVNVLV